MSAERDLLLQAKQFDISALAEIYDLYSPRLYRYAFRLMGDPCLAEDCVAETFSRFLQALRSHSGPRDYLQAYLFRSAHNLIADYYRRQPATVMLTDNSPDSDNTEESTEQNIQQLRVRAAMQELTSDQQQVIALKFFEGWENEQIAQALHKPIGSIKSLQHRALHHLQKVLLEDEL